MKKIITETMSSNENHREIINTQKPNNYVSVIYRVDLTLTAKHPYRDFAIILKVICTDYLCVCFSLFKSFCINQLLFVLPFNVMVLDFSH